MKSMSGSGIAVRDRVDPIYDVRNIRREIAFYQSYITEHSDEPTRVDLCRAVELGRSMQGSIAPESVRRFGDPGQTELMRFRLLSSASSLNTLWN